MVVVSSSLTSSISLKLRHQIKYLLMHPVLPQECTYHRGYVKLKRIPLRPWGRWFWWVNHPTDPPELLGMGFTVSQATPQQQWEIPAMFGIRMLHSRPFDRVVSTWLFSLSFCLFVNIVLNYHFHFKAREMQCSWKLIWNLCPTYRLLIHLIVHDLLNVLRKSNLHNNH